MSRCSMIEVLRDALACIASLLPAPPKDVRPPNIVIGFAELVDGRSIY